MHYPKVLVFSNNCFSKTDSNGRTLGNFFLGWPKDKLAQFYIQNAEPDFSYCSRYYRVTDQQALKALYTENKGGVVHPVSPQTQGSAAASPSQQNTRRNALTMLLRNAVWSLGFWKSREYKAWIKETNPDIVLLQAGDCPFMFHLALKTAKRLGAKLVIYSTEGYYFKQYDYFRSTGMARWLYPLFRSLLKRATKKAYRAADYSIFNCDALDHDFCEAFSLESSVIYTATDLHDVIREKPENNGFVVSYAGNLGVGRPQSLVDVANVLHSIDNQYYLDLYGTLPNNQVKQMFDNCDGIRFHGRISYDEVKEVMRRSDLLLHVESFDPYYREDLKYAFSTKIADCLAANTCFLMYAPEEFAETRYLKQNEAAYVASTLEQLNAVLKTLIDCPDARMKYCENARMLAMKNHDRDSSVRKFQDILRELVP